MNVANFIYFYLLYTITIMTLKPIGNRVVVRLVKQAKTSASGIIISTEDKNEQARGEIIAIGTGLGTEENISNLGLSVGQIILFGKYGGEEVADDKDSTIVYKILKGPDIIAVVE